jgi:hypothetical protein
MSRFVRIAGALGAAALALTANGLDDRFGRPLGSDFSIVYVAGTDVLQGRSADPYYPVRLHDGLVAMFGPDAPWYGWHGRGVEGSGRHQARQSRHGRGQSPIVFRIGRI